MLKTDMKEARTGILEVTDMKETTVEKLLEFVYSGKVSDRVSVDDLLYAADKYLIDDLVCDKVEDFP